MSQTALFITHRPLPGRRESVRAIRDRHVREVTPLLAGVTAFGTARPAWPERVG